MPILSIVHPWPAQLRSDRPTADDEVADVAIRGCRSVAELYSEALVELGIAHRVSELRLFVRHDPDLEEVRAVVEVDPVHEGPEVGGLAVPSQFVARTAHVRGHLLLATVHGIVLRLGEARGWDADALETCRQHVLDRHLEYRWTSPAAMSPDRQHLARAEFRLPPDGYGRVRLRIMRRDDETEVATSEEAVAYCTSQGFARAARSLRWHGKDRVSMVPYDAVPALRGGEVSLTFRDGTWWGSASDYLPVRPVPAGDPGLPTLGVRVEGRGATAVEQPPRIVFLGGGPIQSVAIDHFHDAFRAEMARFASPAGQDWWAGADIRLLEVQVRYQAEQSRVRGRRTGQRLGVVVDVSDSALAGQDPGARARQVVEDVVALVRRRTGLGAHPDFGADQHVGGR